METIIVTGGAGFIGSNFVRHVLETTNHQIVVVDKLTYAGSLANLDGLIDDPRVTFRRLDIRDGETMDAILVVYRPLWIINFAAETHVDRSIDGPRLFVETNVLGTFELLEACRRYLEKLPAERSKLRYLQVSTDEVYGSLSATAPGFSEETPYAPNSPYAATKAGADHLVRAYHETFGLPVLITNCSNNYGPWQFPEKLIPLMIVNALSGSSLPIYGDGKNVRDWLHVADHCRGIVLALQRGSAGEKYNFGGASERTNLEIVDTLCGVLEELRPSGLSGGYTSLKTFVADRPGHDRRYAIDASKARLSLGWEPEHSFVSGIRQTVRWYLENIAWCEQMKTYRQERLGLGK